MPLYGTSYVYSGKPEPAVDADLDGLVFGDMKWMLDGVGLYRQKVAEEAARKAEEKAEAEATALAAEEADALALTAEEEPEEEDGELAGDSEGDSGEEALADEDPALPEDEILKLDLALKDDIIFLDLFTGEPAEGNDLDLVFEDTSPRRPYQDTRMDRLYALGMQSYQVIPRLNGLRGSAWNRFIGDAMTVSVNESGAVIRHPVWSVFRSGLPEPVYNPGSISAELQQVQ